MSFNNGMHGIFSTLMYILCYLICACGELRTVTEGVVCVKLLELPSHNPCSNP